MGRKEFGEQRPYFRLRWFKLLDLRENENATLKYMVFSLAIYESTFIQT